MPHHLRDEFGINYSHQPYTQAAQIEAASAVRAWLRENPPPSDWRASPYAWAFEEMPFFLIFSESVRFPTEKEVAAVTL